MCGTIMVYGVVAYPTTQRRAAKLPHYAPFLPTRCFWEAVRVGKTRRAVLLTMKCP